MSDSSTGEPAAVQRMRVHVLRELAMHRAQFAAGTTPSPLMVGVQGPQGSGKTYLTARLRDALASAPHNLSVAVLSIDDLYLPHIGLVAVANANPDNALLRGRGQPGTHDVPLGTEILRKLRVINEHSANDASEVRIPAFDKSLHGGEGDRTSEGMVMRTPLDVVILEGWCVGFYPISDEEVDRRWEVPVKGLGKDFFKTRGFRKEDVKGINRRLSDYVEWWDCFNTFIQIKPEDAHPYTHIYKWRLQQEHHMKARNGGKGMSDAQVEAFVDRYIPGYVFFGDGVVEGGLDTSGEKRRPPWLSHGLRIEINESREVVHASQF
ncbi:nucleoside triphosphate hydrolase protein [Wolfiporia cocos MD-104 SS10]|uniref:Nucleoside triphosphate hydrolase protein n=1 Tax=Wolfiporia cocos (strain MD-104) TaxID=742152 RepID=A0A2H3J023_WOLCO|nr:nucleoside triphosphate hydrolase protein [Wolfiporia cocos MD-104 SS10]